MSRDWEYRTSLIALTLCSLNWPQRLGYLFTEKANKIRKLTFLSGIVYKRYFAQNETNYNPSLNPGRRRRRRQRSRGPEEGGSPPSRAVSSDLANGRREHTRLLACFGAPGARKPIKGTAEHFTGQTGRCGVGIYETDACEMCRKKKMQFKGTLVNPNCQLLPGRNYAGAAWTLVIALTIHSHIYSYLLFPRSRFSNVCEN